MNRKSNIIYNVIILVATVALAFAVVAVANNTYTAELFPTLSVVPPRCCRRRTAEYRSPRMGARIGGEAGGHGVSLAAPVVFYDRPG